MGKLYVGGKYLCDAKLEVDNEQWESDGNCCLCRRKEYCKKKCGAAKRRNAATLSISERK